MTRIRLLVTTDVHGYVYPYRYADGSEFKGGFARIQAVINKMKDENTVLLDNGDVLEGSALSFYHYHFFPNEASPMSIVMKEIGYDFVNVGNHDFNYGENALLTHLHTTGSKCITTNWIYQGTPYSSYEIKRFNGVKVAFFGLTTQYIPHWERSGNIKNSTFINALECAKETVEKIKTKENPDYIVCLYHGGFEKDLTSGKPTEDLTGENMAYEIVEKVDGIDVLLTGHQHRSLSGKLKNTYYTQTTCYGKEVGCVDIYPEEKRIETSIIPCDLEADKSLLKTIQKEEDECQKWLDKALGTTNMDLKIHDEFDARLHKTQLMTFLNRVVFEKTGADLSASAVFNDATGFGHDITMRNLVSTYVYPNTVVVKEINGKELKEYLEQDAEYFCIENDAIAMNPEFKEPKPQGFNYDMVDGVEYTLKISNPVGSRVVSLTRKGIPVNDSDVFSIALSNYRASGGGNFEMLKNAKTIKEYPESMIDILAEYIMEKKEIRFEEVHNILITK